MTQTADNSQIVQLSIRVTEKEMREIDQIWRSDMTFRNRSDFIRSRIGLGKVESEE